MQRGWVVKSLPNGQLSTRAGSHAEKIFAGDKTGGEGVQTGRKPSKTAGLSTANSTQKSVSNARKSMSNARLGVVCKLVQRNEGLVANGADTDRRESDDVDRAIAPAAFAAEKGIGR